MMMMMRRAHYLNVKAVILVYRLVRLIRFDNARRRKYGKRQLEVNKLIGSQLIGYFAAIKHLIIPYAHHLLVYNVKFVTYFYGRAYKKDMKSNNEVGFILCITFGN